MATEAEVDYVQEERQTWMGVRRVQKIFCFLLFSQCNRKPHAQLSVTLGGKDGDVKKEGST